MADGAGTCDSSARVGLHGAPAKPARSTNSQIHADLADGVVGPRFAELSPYDISLSTGEAAVNNIVYIVGLVVIVLAVLGFFGLR